jgi:hypothetical protein
MRTRGGRQTVDDAVETFFESAGPKVDEQADAQVQQTKVGQELLAVYRSKVFHRLKFNHDLAFHQQ